MYKSLCFVYGKLRRTDFLPVGAEQKGEVLERGFESLDSDNEERGECEWGMREAEEGADDDDLPQPMVSEGNDLVDFM